MLHRANPYVDPATAELTRRHALHRYAEEQIAKARQALEHGRTAAAAEHAEEALCARLTAQAISTDRDG